MIEPVELAKAYRLINHGPVILISSAHGTTRNVMAASWVMPLDFDPPKIAVVIDKSTFTRSLVEPSREFVINIPTVTIARETMAVGSCSGRVGDKFAAAGLNTQPSTVVNAPRVDACVGWLECRLIEESGNQTRHDLFIAEVVAAAADSRAFSDGRWHFQDKTLRTLHHVAGGYFFVTGEALEVSA